MRSSSSERGGRSGRGDQLLAGEWNNEILISRDLDVANAI